jgi:hypothetical protein
LPDVLDVIGEHEKALVVAEQHPRAWSPPAHAPSWSFRRPASRK